MAGDPNLVDPEHGHIVENGVADTFAGDGKSIPHAGRQSRKEAVPLGSIEVAGDQQGGVGREFG